MKLIIKTVLFFFIGIQCGLSQDEITVDAKKIGGIQFYPLSSIDGWVFKQGNDPSWANKELNTSDWIKLKPSELSPEYADKTGRVEGWFRIKLKIANDLVNQPYYFRRGGWAATDLYVDGNLLKSFGNTGTNRKNFLEYNPIDKEASLSNLQVGKEYLIAVHVVDYRSPIPPFQLKSSTGGGVRPETQGLNNFLRITGPQNEILNARISNITLFYRSIWLSVTLLLALLFWLLTFLNPKERKILLLIAVCSSFSALSNVTRFFLTSTDISFLFFRINDLLFKISLWLLLITSFVIVMTVLNARLKQLVKRLLLAYVILGSLTIFTNFYTDFSNDNAIIVLFVVAYFLVRSWKKLKGAQWAIVGGVALAIFFGTLNVLARKLDLSLVPLLLLLTGLYFSVPLSLVVYVALRYREIINEVQKTALRVVQLSEEKKEAAVKQQKILEEEVAKQTVELRTSLENLKSTQSQLIQQEKMASLGEMTAGIAHEIQNPLNFVNNFSEVSNELIDEMKVEFEKGNKEDALAIAEDVKINLEKINHHGKRAGAIVKSMLQHSRSGSGKKEATDINALADEYLRLAYHGLRAKDKTFQAKFETHLDNSIGKIEVVPQELGRVILNLINNAFYAVTEKKKVTTNGYEPSVTVTTKSIGDKILIRVNDNGNGIPQKILDKIFQPFFTTKPTGEGTGLGLSLSYEIITKGHGGELKVETKEGQGSEFTISLPNNYPTI